MQYCNVYLTRQSLSAAAAVHVCCPVTEWAYSQLHSRCMHAQQCTTGKLVGSIWTLGLQQWGAGSPIRQGQISCRSWPVHEPAALEPRLATFGSGRDGT